MSEVTTTLELSGGMLVGHDGSPASAEAVRWAGRLADRLDCTLHVIRTWSISSAPRPATATGGDARRRWPTSRPRWPTGCAPTSPRSAFPRVSRSSATRCTAPPAAGCSKGQRAPTCWCSAPAEGAGSWGLGFGSTADQVVRHAVCPVVVVPVAGEDDPDDLDSQLRSC